MVETVYVDILILTNFIVDYFLLLLTAFLSKNEVKKWRMLVGAAAACLSSLLIFAPELPFIFEMLVKLSVSLGVVLLAFGFKNPLRYIKSVSVFYAANVILAGGTLLLWSIFHPGGLIVRNGAVFYNISPVVLILMTAAVYIISLVVSKIIAGRKARGREYSITLWLEGRKVELVGMMDSGNMLRDTISGTPVIVCDFDKVKALLTPSMEKIFKRENFELGFYQDIITSGISQRFRVIPFDSLGDSGVMAGLVLDRAVIKNGREQQEIEQIIMAVTHKKIAGGEFDVLLNPELITV